LRSRAASSDAARGGRLPTDMEGLIVKRLTLLACCAAVLCAAVWAPAASAAAPPIPITGTIANGGGTFSGTFTPTRFSGRGGELVATGTLTGTLTDATGDLIGPVEQTVTMPVDLDNAQTEASCEILNLVLGPLHLDLLGLVVDLNQIELNITAEPGPGNLLGNLLCAVAGLLDGNASTNGIAALLNRILAILSL
jgi:hypothetical protein